MALHYLNVSLEAFAVLSNFVSFDNWVRHAFNISIQAKTVDWDGAKNEVLRHDSKYSILDWY
jgi:hypothetical protein